MLSSSQPTQAFQARNQHRKDYFVGLVGDDPYEPSKSMVSVVLQSS